MSDLKLGFFEGQNVLFFHDRPMIATDNDFYAWNSGGGVEVSRLDFYDNQYILKSENGTMFFYDDGGDFDGCLVVSL